MGKAEILQQIKLTEAKVRTMTLGAEERRKQLQAEGKRRALEILELSDSSAKAASESKTAKAKTELEKRKKSLVDDGKRKAEALAESARKRMPSAKEYVISEFERASNA